MADISVLARLLNGAMRNVDLTNNTPVVFSIKVGGVTNTELTKAILDKLILIHNAADSDGTFDTRYTQIADLASTANGKGATLVGIEDAGSYFSGSTVESALQQIGAVVGSGAAEDISYDNTDSELTAENVQDAIDELEGRLDTTETVASAAIPATEKGANNGVATLDGGGKIPVTQLPNAVMTYEGMWDPTTNTPTLEDGVGNAGMVYRVSDDETGPITDLDDPSMVDFHAGDYVIYSGSVWQKSDGTDAVTSVNGQQGIVVLDTDDVTEGSTNKYFSAAAAKAAAVEDAIVNGVTDVAPSQNAVFDALALKQDASAELDEAEAFFAATDISGAEAETLTSGVNADSLHSHGSLKVTMTAGESYAADTTFLVRMGIFTNLSETPGRVYKADKDATTDPKYVVIGWVRHGSAASAGDAVVVNLIGTSSAGSFSNGDIGREIFLGTGGTQIMGSSLANTANEAQVAVGVVTGLGAWLFTGMQFRGIA